MNAARRFRFFRRLTVFAGLLSIVALAASWADARGFGRGGHGHRGGHFGGHGHRGGHFGGRGFGHGFGRSYGSYRSYGYRPYSYGYRTYSYRPYYGSYSRSYSYPGSYSYGYRPYYSHQSYGYSPYYSYGQPYSNGYAAPGYSTPGYSTPGAVPAPGGVNPPQQGGTYNGAPKQGNPPTSPGYTSGDPTLAGGWNHFAAGRDIEARNVFAQQANGDPTHGAPKIGYALCTAGMGDLQTGVWAMRRAVRIDPRTVENFQLHRQARPRVEKLVTAYKSRYERNNHDSGSAFMLASLHYLLGDKSTAAGFADKAVHYGDGTQSAANLKRMTGEPAPPRPPQSESPAPQPPIPPLTAER